MAEYNVISDPEIAPEAPGASILFHKLRDNPEAIAEGATGAPRIQTAAYADLSITATKIIDGQVTVTKIASGSIISAKLSLTTGVISNADTSGANFAIPGGIYHLGKVGSVTGHSSPGGYYHANPFTSQALPADISGVLYQIKGGGAGRTMVCTFSYFTGGVFSKAWCFFKVEKSTGDIVSSYIAADHPLFGSGQGVDDLLYPFSDVNFSLYDVVCVNLDYDQWFRLITGQYALIGGGYLTPEIYDAGVYDIDPAVPKRNIYEVFINTFNLVTGVPVPYPVDPTIIGLPRYDIGETEPVTAVLTQPAAVTCLGVTLI